MGTRRRRRAAVPAVRSGYGGGPCWVPRRAIGGAAAQGRCLMAFSGCAWWCCPRPQYRHASILHGGSSRTAYGTVTCEWATVRYAAAWLKSSLPVSLPWLPACCLPLSWSGGCAELRGAVHQPVRLPPARGPSSGLLHSAPGLPGRQGPEPPKCLQLQCVAPILLRQCPLCSMQSW